MKCAKMVKRPKIHKWNNLCPNLRKKKVPLNKVDDLLKSKKSGRFTPTIIESHYWIDSITDGFNSGLMIMVKKPFDPEEL